MQGYNFTTRVRRALQNARAEASRLGHEFVGTEHILLGTLLDVDSIATTALKNLGVDPERLRARIQETLKPGTSGPQEPRKLPYTSRANRILELATQEAREQSSGYVSTEHLLLGVIREERGIAAQVLVDAGVTLAAARSEVARVTRDRGVEPPHVEGDADGIDPVPAVTALPNATETWQVMTQHTGFVVLWLVLGAILFLGGANTLFDFVVGRGPTAFLVVVSAVQFVGAVLFLIPRTLRVGGKLLITSLLVAFVAYAVRGEYPARLIVYAAATFMILVLQSRFLGPRVPRENP